MHPLQFTLSPCGFLMFSGGREMMHWEQMGNENHVVDETHCPM